MPNTLQKYTWFLRSPKDMSVGEDVDVRYYPQGSFDPVGFRIAARRAPTGREFVVDVKAAGVSMLDSRVRGTLPAGMTEHRSTNVANMKGQPGDPITLSLVQVGSQEPGMGVTVEMTVSVASSNT